MLKLLGWHDTDERREEINGAVRRYSLPTYEWGMNSSELMGRDIALYTANECPILEYRTLGNKTEEGRIERTYNSVTFSERFINSLLGRSLFEVKWDKVKSIKLTSGRRKGTSVEDF